MLVFGDLIKCKLRSDQGNMPEAREGSAPRWLGRLSCKLKGGGHAKARGLLAEFHQC